MRNFELTGATLNRLNDLIAQTHGNLNTIVEEWCNCTGFGG